MTTSRVVDLGGIGPPPPQPARTYLARMTSVGLAFGTGGCAVNQNRLIREPVHGWLDLGRIELPPAQCECAIIPFYYRPSQP